MKEIELDERVLSLVRVALNERCDSINQMRSLLRFLNTSITSSDLSLINEDINLVLQFCSRLETSMNPDLDILELSKKIGNELSIKNPIRLLRIILTGSDSGIPIRLIIKSIGEEQSLERIADIRKIVGDQK